MPCLNMTTKRNWLLSMSESAALDSIRKKTAQKLFLAGIDQPVMEADLLISFALSCKREYVHAHSERFLSDEEQTNICALADRRSGHEPFAYITGKKEFFSLEFFVNSDVLIPRPETELIISWILEHDFKSPYLEVLDLGTGSGAIAVTLAVHRPRFSITASDLSQKALNTAKKNACKNNVGEQISFCHSDLFRNIEGKFDLIVCNPPYIPRSEAEKLDPEVRNFEPEEALFGGPDGMEIYKRILKAFSSYLKNQGLLVMEMGVEVADPLQALCRESGFSYSVFKDLSGRDRFLVLSHPCRSVSG